MIIRFSTNKSSSFSIWLSTSFHFLQSAPQMTLIYVSKRMARACGSTHGIPDESKSYHQNLTLHQPPPCPHDTRTSHLTTLAQFCPQARVCGTRATTPRGTVRCSTHIENALMTTSASQSSRSGGLSTGILGCAWARGSSSMSRAPA